MRIAFLFLLLLSPGMLHSQEPAPMTCAGVAAIDPPEDGLKPGAVLHPSSSPVTVEVHFVQNYKNSSETYSTDPWAQIQRNEVCAAARHLQEIWSSVEFAKALNRSSVVLTRVADKEGKVISTIRGDELYGKLMSKPIVLTVALTSDRSIVRNCGVSDSSSDQTALQSRYVVKLKYRCGEPPLLPALTNTLGHEYTHYAVVNSNDMGKKAVDNVTYVSYGVGCLTQMIGFPQNACTYQNAGTLLPSP